MMAMVAGTAAVTVAGDADPSLETYSTEFHFGTAGPYSHVTRNRESSEMGKHKRDHRSTGDSHGRGRSPNGNFGNGTSADSPALRRMRPIGWVAVAVGVALWSFVAWLGYIFVDGILSWAAANVGGAVKTGTNLATSTGFGKEVVGVVDSLNVVGPLGQFIALLQTIAKPAIVVLWATGVLLLFTAPFFLPRIVRRLALRRN